MQERLWLGDKTRRRAKPRATYTEEFTEGKRRGSVGANKNGVSNGITKTYHVYCHHEHAHCQVNFGDAYNFLPSRITKP